MLKTETQQTFVMDLIGFAFKHLCLRVEARVYYLQ